MLDGPLPIGDVIATLGILWTAWDISTAQKEFEKRVYTAVYNMLQAPADHLARTANGLCKSVCNKSENDLLKIKSAAIKSVS